MPTFSYRARTAAGDAKTGTLVAETVAAASRMLDEQRLLPVELNEVQAQKRSFFTGGARRISVSKIGQIYEQLADLLRAGVPILRALKVLSQQSASPAITQVLREVHDDVSGGDALADAMEKHPQAFPELHAAMVRAGEKGGFLEDVLSRLSEFVSRQDALKNKFIGALIYPCVLLLGATGAVTFIMSYVVPQIRRILQNQDLPFLTTAVFGLSDVIRAHYAAILGVLLVIVLGVIAWLGSAAGKAMWARLQLKIPGLGPIFTMIALCRFCRVFGTMLANGIPILQSLKISKDSTGNPVLAAAIEEAAESVRGGDTLAGPLVRSKVFPLVIVDMIAVAEESNSLDKVLVQIANTQEERTARQIDFTMRLLEPLLLMIMGAVIACIALAILVPILKLSTSGIK